jgi:general secretion pathway protein N
MMSLLTKTLAKRAFVVGSLATIGLGIAASQGAFESEIGATKSLPARIASGSIPTATSQPVKGIPSGSTGRANPLWAIPLASLTATRERPIFSPTRRPPPGVTLVSAPSSPLAERPMLALVGAIAGEEEGVAIFRDETSKDTIRLRTGDSHFGWTLQTVKAREATLQKDHKTTILVLPNPPAQ